MMQIRFTKPCWSAVFGSFGPGDLLRCSDDAARHFVVDAQAAEYVQAPAALADMAPVIVPDPVEPPAKRRPKG